MNIPVESLIALSGVLWAMFGVAAMGLKSSLVGMKQ